MDGWALYDEAILGLAALVILFGIQPPPGWMVIMAVLAALNMGMIFTDLWKEGG